MKTLKIAVICNKDGCTATLFEKPQLVVYEKDAPGAGWEAVQTVHPEIDPEQGLRSVRAAVSTLAESLGGAKVIVGKSVTGVSYNLLDCAGFAVFELPGRPERFLDYVKVQLECDEEEKAQAADYPDRPQPTDEEGRFELDLIELQKMRPEISSKMALLPFLRGTPFYELTISCAHIPPWFERDFAAMGLISEALPLENGVYKVAVRHSECKEAETP